MNEADFAFSGRLFFLPQVQSCVILVLRIAFFNGVHDGMMPAIAPYGVAVNSLRIVAGISIFASVAGANWLVHIFLRE